MSVSHSQAVKTRPVTYGRDASYPKFSVRKYQQMIDDDILDENDRVELLENYLVLQMSRNPEHDSVLQTLQMVLMGFVPTGWSLRTQSAIELHDSQPEPDLAVVRGHGRDYLKHHPRVTDIGLIIEIANTSLLRDTADKARIYARAAIPTYWIINLPDRCCEVHTRPATSLRQSRYRRRDVYRGNASIPFVLDGKSVAMIPVSELLP